MKQWWQQLQQREQYLVIAMSLLVGIFVLHQAVWQPVISGLDRAEKKQKRTKELLSYVKESTAAIAASGKKTSRKINGGSLSSIVNRTAGQYQIAIARIQPQGDAVQVWIDDVPFEQLLRLLDNLTVQQGLSVNNIDISIGNDPGVVKVRRLNIARG
ncbi:type II secretion system protein M [Thalassotalea sp. M1531]|uniref:Type II secretion system protein M n=1 Tax=Thalassotalea algicola TaxID=2716224 RepID=A0A7Y0Q5K5_9GAMM|nr:type II secretion system protein M [Thalassotalea algicola]NMP30423.1 type II secretion system protein M [Thalassotalea algicola]